MESKVCVANNPKRNRSDDEEHVQDSKYKKRHNSRDRHSTRDNCSKDSNRRYKDLKVGDPYYSGGTLTDNLKDESRFKDESRHRRRFRSKDRNEKENKSKNAESQKEEKIGAPYYSGGIAAIEHETGEVSTDDDGDKVGQRYYSTDAADSHRTNSENYWNKYSNKDKNRKIENPDVSYNNICNLYYS